MKRCIVLIFATVVLTTACGSSGPKTGRPRQEPLNACPDPRPATCPSDYRPVCAVKKRKTATFANGCQACAEKSVKGFYLHACPEPEPAQDAAAKGNDDG